MFEFYLTYGEENVEVDPYAAADPFLEEVKPNKKEYVHGNLRVVTLSHEAEDKFFYEDDTHVIFVRGDVFFRLPYTGLGEHRISPQRLLQYIRSESDFYKRIKGEFTIILFNKVSGLFRLYLDHFAILPTYFAKINGSLVLTNNLNQFKFFNLPKDPVVLLEHLVFGYGIRKDTLFKGVKVLAEGSLLEAKGAEQSIKSLFRLSELVFREDLHRFDAAEFNKLFQKVLSQYSNEQEDVRFRLKNDLVSRMTFSALGKRKRNLNTFFIATNDSEVNTVKDLEKVVAGEIFIFEKEKERAAEFQSVLENIYFSEGQDYLKGIEPLRFAKGFDKPGIKVLSARSGNKFMIPFGIESKGVNQYYYDAIYLKKDINLNEVLREKGLSPYVDQSTIDNNSIVFHDRIQEKRKDVAGKMIGEEGFLYVIYDMMKLVLKQTDGNTVHSRRHLIREHVPFWDIDLLQYLIRSHHNVLYKSCYKEKHWKSIKPYQLLAKVLEMNNPALNKVPSKLDFLPAKLLSTLGRLTIPSALDKAYKKSLRDKSLDKATRLAFLSELSKLELPSSRFFDAEELKKWSKSDLAKNSDQLDAVIRLYIWLEIL